jgi:hypothetical protein
VSAPTKLPKTSELLATRVAFGGSERPFGELRAEEVEARAAELGEATGFGHRSRVGAVAAAWKELAALMRERGAETVTDLSGTEIAERAERLWIVPPGGSLL